MPLAALPFGMTAHVVFTALDPGLPATTSAIMIGQDGKLSVDHGLERPGLSGAHPQGNRMYRVSLGSGGFGSRRAKVGVEPDPPEDTIADRSKTFEETWVGLRGAAHFWPAGVAIADELS